jgi:hypothetical protein
MEPGQTPNVLSGMSDAGQSTFAEPVRESDPMHDEQLAQSCGTISVTRGMLLCEAGKPIPIMR